MRPLLLILISLISLTSFAQNRVGINEVELATQKGLQPAFEFFIPDTDAEAVVTAWNKFHKTFKAKPKQDKDQRNYYFSDDAYIPELSENTIDIYARIYETGGGVRFACAFDLGGVFVSSRKTQDKFTQTKLLLNKFYAQIAMDAIIAEIQTELKELEAIKAEYDAISKEIAVFEGKSKSYSQTIEKAQSDESSVQKQLENKSGELAERQTELTNIQSELRSINVSGMLAELTSYNDNLKKNSLETTKIEKDVDRKKAEIASIEAEINILNNDLVKKKSYGADLVRKITEIENRLEELQVDEKQHTAKLLEQNITRIESVKKQLTTKKSTYAKTISTEESKLNKAREAMNISIETRALLSTQIKEKEAKLKELEELKATIE